jgi:hypothetical protein
MPNHRVSISPGDRYHKIVIVRELDKRINPCGMSQRVFLFRCDCGVEKSATLAHIRTGSVQSCGCIVRTKNGMGRSSLCNVWRGIKSRCYGKANAKYYSERGITMCEEWRNSFEAFKDWSMGNGYEHGLQIDRINNDGNYEPSNCRWVSAKVNANNRRKYVRIRNRQV